MQDIFVSQSKVYFENKWSLVEVGSPGKSFAEFQAGNSRIESTEHSETERIYSSMYFKAASKKR